ncbi:MAG: 2-oxo acid dehydrogenase subunit E2 [Thermoplasmata archaeon]
MEHTGTYREVPFPKSRDIIVDTGEAGRRVHHVKALFELDVTEGRRRIRDDAEGTGKKLSFTGWIMRCLGEAVSAHPSVHARRRGRRKMVIFDDVDIAVSVERTLEGSSFPILRVIRKANEKSVEEITEEIRAAQVQTAEDYLDSSEVRGARRLVALPRPLRRLLFWRKLRRDPFFLKRHGGTVSLTSVGMFVRRGGWPIPLSAYGLTVALGGIAEKPGVVQDQIVVREYLSITVAIDHDVVDGAPAARFLARLAELVESGFGLP